MSPSLRQRIAPLHGWAGLLLGWLAYAMCLSGTLAVFRPEISRWMRPETIARAPQPEAVAAAVAWLGRNAAGAPAWFLVPADARANVTLAAWRDAAAPGGFRSVALDPVNGAPAPRDTLGGDFFYRLHFELQLPYPTGRLLASLAAAFLLVAIVTGIVIHRRFFADLFTLRPGKGARTWLDAHNLFGVVALPFHLMIVYSGLAMLATLSMPWAIRSAYSAELSRAFAEFTPGEVERPAAGRQAPPVPVALLLREAARRTGQPAGSVVIAHPGDGAATVTIVASDAGQLARQPERLVFDGPSGRLLAYAVERRPIHRAYDVVYGLHMGRFAAIDLRWLYFLGGLLLSGTVASGLLLWVAKRRQRSADPGRHTAVARLNAGVIAGTPLAFASYFLANRLVPPELAGRAAVEVAAVFWVWGGALAAALVMPARIGIRLLAGAGASAWTAAGVLGLAGWGEDRVIDGVTLALLGAGGVFALVAGWGLRLPSPRVRIGRPLQAPAE